MSVAFDSKIIIELRDRMLKLNHEFFGYENYENRIIPSIRNSYKHGESNSLIIIGKKGSGKTHLINALINDLQRDDKFCRNMFQVKLNGLIHTNDKIALKSIASQLKYHLINNDDDDNVDSGDNNVECDNFAKNFEYILSFLRSGNSEESVSLLFIIEEFDMFLHHKNQILIYNLFNSAQSSGTPIFVLGSTTRVDFLELMEKRVKSRFSHCQINLIPYATSFELYIDAARRLLTITGNRKPIQMWNKSVADFLSDSRVLKNLEQNYLISNTISELKKILIVPISRLNVLNFVLNPADIEESRQILSVDYKSEILQNLSQLEFTFLAAMVTCAARRDGDINFAIVYDAYKSFCQHLLVVYDKTVLWKCLNNLIDLDLVGVKKMANLSANFYTLDCYISQKDMIECIKRKSVSTHLQNYILQKL